MASRGPRYASLRVERPHPEWPRRINRLVYGQTGFDKPHWLGTNRELDELLAVPELAHWQWRDFLVEVKQHS